MSDLAEWLRAQLDEDERVACEAAPDPSLRWTDDSADAPPAGWNPLTHIARWDPARVLAEVDAKRRLLNVYLEADNYYRDHRAAPAGELHGLWTAIQLIAAAYAGHPGYREEWRPTT